MKFSLKVKCLYLFSLLLSLAVLSLGCVCPECVNYVFGLMSKTTGTVKCRHYNNVTARFHHMRSWVVVKSNDVLTKREKCLSDACMCVFFEHLWCAKPTLWTDEYVGWILLTIRCIFSLKGSNSLKQPKAWGKRRVPRMDACVKISTYQEFFYMLVTKTHLFFQEKKNV